MKKLSTYLFLILFGFSAPSFADDISEYQIEGISIGDSLLDYMSEEEIKENIGFVYEDKKFTISEYNKSFELYDAIGFSYKTDDKKYIVQGIQGQIDFIDDIKNCYKKQDEIVEELSSLFSNQEKKEYDILSRDDGTYKPTTFKFSSGDAVSVACHKLDSYIDHLKITLYSKEYTDYVSRQ
jgi:hypothetical protein